MTTQIERHDIQDGLYVYKQNNSERWYSRFVLYGKWYSKATKEKELGNAVARAHLILMEYKVKAENNLLVDSKRFKDVADRVIKNLQNELDNGGGKVTYRDYIQALNKYHIPYFDRTYITSIDQESINAFNKWRIEKFNRIPAKSTLLTHNSAMNLVFKEAIEHKWMIAAQVPVLHTKGESGKRRAAFSQEDYDKVYDTILDLVENSRKEKTKQIRELLLSYMEFCVNTGIRPGTEMEGITWGDIEMTRQDHNVRFKVKVRKGKTTKHTGTRTVIARDQIWDCLEELRQRFPDRRPNDKLFRLEDGESTNELGVAFRKALEECNLKDSSDGPRTLYSLRHSYITWQLLRRDLRLDILAKQCGTSVAMIEQHYSHVVPSMFEEELSGVKFKKQPKKEKPMTEKALEIIENRFKSWEAEYKKRGCI
ncbi:site-specific integrase [Colwellia sp. 1_MG-2023]|uniref:tyrosine-type recombinase/integrase n=1 Tax=Colwellia sp. 1_MG-2023 TaxID=3062649 RepID=UPI0026E18E71|nr:tyrosine-type recombinase/integrase [Colwellia sp. 1_MG-2023]MDO6447165.1 site-specific integrase [Colwellia sp. 1_MG-2023]